MHDESRAAAANGGYLYSLFETADATNLEGFISDAFATNPEILLQILKSRNSWYINENYLAKFVQNKNISAARKQKILSQIENAATDLGNKYHFAAAMTVVGENDRAIRLLQVCISALPTAGNEEKESEFFDKYDFEREGVYRNLFKAYLQKADWKNAEKVLMANPEIFWYWYGRLQGAMEELILVAANAGATNDAVRLWTMRTNLDRRRLEFLQELAMTKAKEPLRQFYLQVKQRDPQTTAPDKALAILQ